MAFQQTLILLFVFFTGFACGFILSVKMRIYPVEEEKLWLLRHKYLDYGYCPICMKKEGRITMPNVEFKNKYK